VIFSLHRRPPRDSMGPIYTHCTVHPVWSGTPPLPRRVDVRQRNISHTLRQRLVATRIGQRILQSGCADRLNDNSRAPFRSDLQGRARLLVVNPLHSIQFGGAQQYTPAAMGLKAVNLHWNFVSASGLFSEPDKAVNQRAPLPGALESQAAEGTPDGLPAVLHHSPHGQLESGLPPQLLCRVQETTTRRIAG
jgi:hypothetical protein